MNFFRFFDGKVGGGAEWFLPSNLIHFAYTKTAEFTARTFRPVEHRAQAKVQLTA